MSKYEYQVDKRILFKTNILHHYKVLNSYYLLQIRIVSIVKCFVNYRPIRHKLLSINIEKHKKTHCIVDD